ncbi:hypothetical protein KIL84_008127 [Mauremys mutica]|uniref:Uncharacterized protein n=1 Tax=Mauremys mutica TaxID=74926 RepID=A0A9D3WPU9_9SAUR|nr:hypothetical protein KIL84_008127 [Mauremys mutica]
MGISIYLSSTRVGGKKERNKAMFLYLERERSFSRQTEGLHSYWFNRPHTASDSFLNIYLLLEGASRENKVLWCKRCDCDAEDETFLSELKGRFTPQESGKWNYFYL